MKNFHWRITTIIFQVLKYTIAGFFYIQFISFLFKKLSNLWLILLFVFDNIHGTTICSFFDLFFILWKIHIFFNNGYIVVVRDLENLRASLCAQSAADTSIFNPYLGNWHRSRGCAFTSGIVKAHRPPRRPPPPSQVTSPFGPKPSPLSLIGSSINLSFWQTAYQPRAIAPPASGTMRIRRGTCGKKLAKQTIDGNLFVPFEEIKWKTLK